MARNRWIAFFVLFNVVGTLLATATLPGNMGGGPVVRFLNLALGIAVLSMPLLVVAYVASKSTGGRLRFSLRTLLVATTLVAVVLGWRYGWGGERRRRACRGIGSWHLQSASETPPTEERESCSTVVSRQLFDFELRPLEVRGTAGRVSSGTRMACGDDALAAVSDCSRPL
jgi:hypothetical protein